VKFVGLWDRQIDWKERDEGTGKYRVGSVHKEKKSKYKISIFSRIIYKINMLRIHTKQRIMNRNKS